MSNFPRLYQYTDLLARRDTALLSIFTLVLIGVALLINGRWSWPRLMPYIRALMVVVFYLFGLAFMGLEFYIHR